ncbi:SRPBCC family protein [Sphingomonas mesophila]|uniref:SRPBCC family protein n=1 Tax=Sphingomonas mesophila TaxID=2303576 RepID=UPI000E57796A|nr:ATPase [Sphingomonas mesophila]
MKTCVIAASALLAAPASAEVVSSGPNGFVLRHALELSVPPERAFAAIGDLPRWWNKDHSYSGDSANLSFALRPGGCFCEKLGSGGIEHLRVTLVQPNERVVLTGSLGPLLFEATAGVMDWKIARTPGGSRVTVEYRVAGFAGGGAARLAPLVDQVIGEQVRRYGARAVR